MNEVIVFKIKKKTSWILLIVFLVVAGVSLFWLVEKKTERRKGFEEWRREHKKLVEESKEYSMRQHINHVDRGEKYNKFCEICNGG